MKHLILFLVFIPVFSIAQVKYASTTFGLGISSGTKNSGGVNFIFDSSFKVKDKHLISGSVNFGNEFNLFDAKLNFSEFNLFYGRSIAVSSSVILEPQVGVGVYTLRYKNGDTDFKTIKEIKPALPIRVKLLFKTGKYFAIGLMPTVNFNGVNDTSTINLVFQFLSKN